MKILLTSLLLTIMVGTGHSSDIKSDRTDPQLTNDLLPLPSGGDILIEPLPLPDGSEEFPEFMPYEYKGDKRGFNK